MMTLSLRFSFIIALMRNGLFFLGTVTVIHDQLLRGADEDEDQSKYANGKTWYDSEVQNYTRIGQYLKHRNRIIRVIYSYWSPCGILHP